MKNTTSFLLCALFAFASTICFVQIDSAFSDKYNVNWIWFAGGIITGLLSALFMGVTIYNSRK